MILPLMIMEVTGLEPTTFCVQKQTVYQVTYTPETQLKLFQKVVLLRVKKCVFL